MLFVRYRALVWALLLLFSLLLHALVSWRIGENMESLAPLLADSELHSEVQIVMDSPGEDLVHQNPPPPEQRLEFQVKPDEIPPETLIAPLAVKVPPPDVSAELRAQSRGFQGIKLDSGLASVLVSEGNGVGGFRKGIGTGFGDGTETFAHFIDSLRETGFDVVFCIDATGSMGWVIEEVKAHIQQITQIVRSLVPIARFGLVAYRDRQDPEFTTRIQPLTYSTAKLYRFLKSLKAEGGGDWFEAIDAGLEEAIAKSGWRVGARKLIILIGDAPLPQQYLDRTLGLVKQFNYSGGIVSTLDVSEQANPQLLERKLGRKVLYTLYRNAPMRDFLAIGEAGQGDTATLDGETKITKRIIELIMGDQFAAEMRALLDVI